MKNQTTERERRDKQYNRESWMIILVMAMALTFFIAIGILAALDN